RRGGHRDGRPGEPGLAESELLFRLVLEAVLSLGDFLEESLVRARGFRELTGLPPELRDVEEELRPGVVLVGLQISLQRAVVVAGLGAGVGERDLGARQLAGGRRFVLL